MFGTLIGIFGSAQAAPSFAEVRAAYTESDAQLLADDGQVLASVRLDKTARRLPWTRIEDVSPAFLRALLAAEDRQFYAHSGVDWGAAASSAWRNLWAKRTRGASTLSMQLVGLLDEERVRKQRAQGTRRSLTEKVSQAASALWLEQRWKKDEILEAYLNLVSFRGELIGIAAMSRGLFGKWPDGLNAQEAALAAALLRAPNASPTLVVTRACGVLQAIDEMRIKQKTPQKNTQKTQQSPPAPASDLCAGLDGLARLALAGGLRAPPEAGGLLGEVEAPGFAQHLAQKMLTQPGERLRSSLNAPLQRFAGAALQRQLREIFQQNAEDGAVLVLDNATGKVLAWVGSSGTLSASAEVDAVLALRQAGSTLKPFLFGLAMDQKKLTAASLIDDSPLALSTGSGLYAPQNYVAQYRGWVSARAALGGSLNVPAVRTLVRVGLDDFHAQLLDFGFKSLTEDGDYYGFSLALGSADVSLLMLANAYRALANGGQWSPLRVTENFEHAPCSTGACAGVFAPNARSASMTSRAMSQEAAFIVADILSDRSARAETFGLESWLATPYWSAVKTGTSKDMRDNWCVGFSRQFTVAVWVGNAAGSAMHDVSGVSGAAPIWREVIDFLHRDDPKSGKSGVRSESPPAPKSLIKRAIRFEPSRRILEAARDEWFLPGTQMDVVHLAESEALAHITYPSQGTIIALDPDIPPMRQRILLQLSGAAAPGWQWQLDKKILGSAERPLLWLPRPGKHRLRLLEGDGREVEALNFEVRALRGRKP